MEKLEDFALRMKEYQFDASDESTFNNLINHEVNIDKLQRLVVEYLPYTAISKPICERIMEIAPAEIDARVLLGWVYWFEGEDDEGRKQLEKAEKIAPGHIEVLILKAAFTKNLNEKIYLYKLVLEKDPNHKIAQDKLKELVDSCGKSTNAESDTIPGIT